MQTIKIKALDGTAVEFTDTLIGQGGMKDVYFSPDKSYVVAFFRDIPKGTAEYSAKIFSGSKKRRPPKEDSRIEDTKTAKIQ